MPATSTDLALRLRMPGSMAGLCQGAFGLITCVRSTTQFVFLEPTVSSAPVLLTVHRNNYNIATVVYLSVCLRIVIIPKRGHPGKEPYSL